MNGDGPGGYEKSPLRIEDGYLCEVNGPCDAVAVWEIIFSDDLYRLCETHAKDPAGLLPEP